MSETGTSIGVMPLSLAAATGNILLDPGCARIGCASDGRDELRIGGTEAGGNAGTGDPCA